MSAFLSKMFDAGDLLVLTFGNCVLKAGVIKWPLKLYYVFYFFQNAKNMTYVFELLHMFSQTLNSTSCPSVF